MRHAKNIAGVHPTGADMHLWSSVRHLDATGEREIRRARLGHVAGGAAIAVGMILGAGGAVALVWWGVWWLGGRH